YNTVAWKLLVGQIYAVPILDSSPLLVI
ncbi:DUF4017 family protein, partial [Halalkalibacterium halodurans]